MIKIVFSVCFPIIDVLWQLTLFEQELSNSIQVEPPVFPFMATARYVQSMLHAKFIQYFLKSF